MHRFTWWASPDSLSTRLLVEHDVDVNVERPARRTSEHADLIDFFCFS